MRFLFLGSVPLALLALLWATLALRGRPPKRYVLNAVIGLVLLGYFAATAGLGLFWVARQELPVFDPHYLFGYLTIVLVAVHVGVNARQLVKLASQRAPRVLVEPDRASFRAPLRLVGKLAAVAAFGGACFFLGRARGTLVVVAPSGPMGAPPAIPPMPAVTPAAPAPLPPQIVQARGVDVDVAELYHRESAHAHGDSFDFGRRPEPFKAYEGAARVPLPRVAPAGAMSTARAMTSALRPVDALYPRVVSLAELSALLQMADGLTGPGRAAPGVDFVQRRAAPSAGALYPTNLYVIARNVEGLSPGVYYYNAGESSLALVHRGERLSDLAGLTASSELVGGASLAVVLTTEYLRSSFKYGVRSYRFDLLDAGHIGENVALGSEYLGLAAAPIGRFDDLGVDGLLEVQAERESAVLVLAVGERAPAPARVPAEWPFIAAPARLASADVPAAILLVHGQTMLARAADHGAVVAPFAPRPRVAAPSGGAVVALPERRAGDDDLAASIAKRRTSRSWADRPMPLADLASVLHLALGRGPGARYAGVGEDGAVRRYVLALRVEGLAKGVYTFDAEANVLRSLWAADLGESVFRASHMQGFPAAANAIVVHVADRAALGYPDGSRGYRDALLSAGMAGERIYLAATSLGLGAGGVGSFEDADADALLGGAGEHPLALYLTAVGVLP